LAFFSELCTDLLPPYGCRLNHSGMWLRYQNVQTGNPDMLNLDLIEEIGITEDSELIDHYAIAAYTQGSDDPLILFRSPSYSEVAERFDQVAEFVGARPL
jgi:hypothetical protein